MPDSLCALTAEAAVLTDVTAVRAAAPRSWGLKDQRGGCARAALPSPAAVAASVALRINKLLIRSG